MPRRLTATSHDQRLDRVLCALEREILEATDEEVRQAAADLGIDPDMKGSIAWVGVFLAAKWRPEEIFDVDALRAYMSRKRITRPRGED